MEASTFRIHIHDIIHATVSSIHLYLYNTYVLNNSRFYDAVYVRFNAPHTHMPRLSHRSREEKLFHSQHQLRAFGGSLPEISYIALNSWGRHAYMCNAEWTCPDRKLCPWACNACETLQDRINPSLVPPNGQGTLREHRWIENHSVADRSHSQIIWALKLHNE